MVDDLVEELLAQLDLAIPLARSLLIRIRKPLVLIPASKNGTFYPVDGTKKSEYELSYPGVDVLQELRSIRQWAIDNPSKRKTLTGMAHHMTNTPINIGVCAL